MVKFIKRIAIGYALIVVFAVGAVVFILSGCNDRVMRYVLAVINELETD